MTLILDTPTPTTIRTPRLSVSLRTLTAQQQIAWHQLLEDHYDATTPDQIKALHRTAATDFGIYLPDGDELVECECDDCYCDSISARSRCAEYADGNVMRAQCQACADTHRNYGH
ncbi:hypothetical protein ACFV3R_25610 [Streptomyces sp. NPDC059740]|uniref:hypothetical protein n=1 Tax=Streptomyces sp. NPDC059740 TaxID=3346926 RepID=UPI00365E9F99